MQLRVRVAERLRREADGLVLRLQLRYALALFEDAALATKGLGAPGLCPSAKPCPVSKVAAFKITYPCTCLLYTSFSFAVVRQIIPYL